MKRHIFALFALAAAGLLPGMAQEQDRPAPAQQGMMMKGGMMQNGMMQGGMLGMHIMPVTVTGLDTKTGLVDGTSGGMSLKLHFPAASLAGVKVGDKLSVHLGFTKS